MLLTFRQCGDSFAFFHVGLSRYLLRSRAFTWNRLGDLLN